MVPDKPQKVENFHFTWCGYIGFRARCYVKACTILMSLYICCQYLRFNWTWFVQLMPNNLYGQQFLSGNWYQEIPECQNYLSMQVSTLHKRQSQLLFWTKFRSEFVKNSDMKSHMLTKNVSRKHMASELATEFLKNSNSILVGKAAGFP